MASQLRLAISLAPLRGFAPEPWTDVSIELEWRARFEDSGGWERGFDREAGVSCQARPPANPEQSSDSNEEEPE
jgi:hypothetical protein